MQCAQVKNVDCCLFLAWEYAVLMAKNTGCRQSGHGNMHCKGEKYRLLFIPGILSHIPPPASARLPVCPSLHRSACLFVSSWICPLLLLPFSSLCLYQSSCLPVSLCISLRLYPSLCLSVPLSACLFACLLPVSMFVLFGLSRSDYLTPSLPVSEECLSLYLSVNLLASHICPRPLLLIYLSACQSFCPDGIYSRHFILFVTYFASVSVSWKEPYRSLVPNCICLCWHVNTGIIRWEQIDKCLFSFSSSTVNQKCNMEVWIHLFWSPIPPHTLTTVITYLISVYTHPVPCILYSCSHHNILP